MLVYVCAYVCACMKYAAMFVFMYLLCLNSVVKLPPGLDIVQCANVQGTKAVTEHVFTRKRSNLKS